MIITLKGADFSQSNIGTLDSWFISWSGSGLTAAAGNVTSIKKDGTSTTTLTYTYNTENYEYVSGTVKDATGATVGSVSASNGTVTVTINAGNTINGKITIAISMNYIGTDEEPDNGGGSEPETPVDPPSSGGTTTVDYGTLISSPINLRGGAVEYIIVKPEFYTSILNKKITKIRIYKVTDSSNTSKTTIGIGKVALSGNFVSASQTTSGLATAYSNISSYKTYDVASYTNKTMMELDCDITLSDGEYLCFETKNGHCVGYCNDSPQTQQMMYIYQGVVEPRAGSETSQQLPISVTVEE